MFKRRAEAIFQDVCVALKDHAFELQLNPAGNPKRGSFEISVNEELIWSGLGKGPPRKLKFPDSEELIDKFRKVLKK